MAVGLIAMVIGAAVIAGSLCYPLYKHYHKKKAMHKLVQQFMQDYFLIERDYMEAYREMIYKACMENTKENFRNKG